MFLSGQRARSSRDSSLIAAHAWRSSRLAAAALTIATGCVSSRAPETPAQQTPTGAGAATDDMSPATLTAGQQVFRFDTFGDEQFWTDTLHLERVVQQAVDPTTALSVGLKVDMDALPPEVVQAIQQGKVDLKSPATTVTLLKLNAVVGLQATLGTANGKDTVTRLGVTCALCHSTVDDAFAKGIGHRKDGWPNRDLNVGAIIALSPAVTPAQKAVYSSWGPASTIHGSTSTARTRHLCCRPPTGSPKCKTRPTRRRARSRTGTPTSP